MMSPSLSKSQQYCLRWNNHQSNLLCNFSRLLTSDAFTDVLLAAEGRTLRAHKVVLSACSSYFEALFVAFDQPKQIVILKDTPYEDAVAIVEFMYKGEVNIAQSQLQSLLKTAENLKVKGLTEVEASAAGEDGGGAALSLLPEQDAPLSLTPATSSSGGSKTNGKGQGHSGYSSTKHLLPEAARIKMAASSGTPGSAGGEIKRKRGRPRILDSPGETPDPCFTPSSSSSLAAAAAAAAAAASAPPAPKMSRAHERSLASAAAALSAAAASSLAGPSTSAAPEDFAAAAMLENSFSGPTPGGPLTPDRIDSLGIVKMGDYLSAGTRQQFWEEYYVKVIMQVRGEWCSKSEQWRISPKI